LHFRLESAKVKNVNIFNELKENPELFVADIVRIMNEQPFKGAEYVTTQGAVPFELCKEGELYMCSQGAGGGYGDVLDRDPRLVIKDIEEGLLSESVAKKLFCIQFDPATLAVDVVATDEARRTERKARIARGKPFDEFCESWVTASPPKDIPYFGSWGNDVGTIYANGVQGTPETIPLVMMPDPRDVTISRLQSKIKDLENKLVNVS
jgi:acetone carboxylase alpha subunit